MKTYKAITINGEPHLELPSELQKSPSYGFYETQQTIIPYIGPAIPDGTILDESEVEIKFQYFNNYGKWEDCDKKVWGIDVLDKNGGWLTRQVATRKAKEPERGYTITSVSNSEEGEQPVKKVKLIGGGGSIALVDFEDDTVSFTNYGVLDEVQSLSFEDIIKIANTISPTSSPQEGEQPVKEESQEELWLKAIDFIEVFADGVSNIHKHAAKTMVKHGWILTKK